MADRQLFTKFTLGGQELKNRMVLAPMSRSRCTPNMENHHDPINTQPNDVMAEYYAQRASAGLVLTEATAISELGFGWARSPTIRTKENAEGWKKVTDAVHEKGSPIYLQLWHMGRQGHSSYHPSINYVVSASDIPAEGEVHTLTGEKKPFEVPRPLTIDEIKATVQDYVKAARLAKEAGFDGVEVHSANGYLLDQFLQSVSNKRTDEYGGSFENRARFLMEVLEALIADGAYPANRIGVRLSPNGAYGSMGSEDNYELFPYVAKELNKFGLAYLHVMDGHGFGFHGKCKSVTPMDLRKNFDGPIIANVGLTRDTAEGMIRSGAVDLCAFGRPWISNPDLVERYENDWPLNDPAPFSVWYSPTGAKGYTDYPVYKKPEE